MKGLGVTGMVLLSVVWRASKCTCLEPALIEDYFRAERIEVEDADQDLLPVLPVWGKTW